MLLLSFDTSLPLPLTFVMVFVFLTGAHFAAASLFYAYYNRGGTFLSKYF